MDYSVVRGKRKTVQIRVLPDGTVQVLAPKGYPDRDIEAIIQKHREWIEARLLIVQARLEKRKVFSVSPGDSLYYFGKAYPVLENRAGSVRFDYQAFYVPPRCFEEIKGPLLRLYRTLAEEAVKERVNLWSERLRLYPESVKITGAKTRWGSCSNRKSLNFSWRLVMASPEAVDYVVVHELAHIAEMNHSARFWELVCRYVPDYKLRKKELSLLQQRLAEEDWD